MAYKFPDWCYRCTNRSASNCLGCVDSDPLHPSMFKGHKFPDFCPGCKRVSLGADHKWCKECIIDKELRGPLRPSRFEQSGDDIPFDDGDDLLGELIEMNGIGLNYIPSAFTIAGRRIEVLRPKEIGALGRCNHQTQTIEVAQETDGVKLAEDLQYETFWHEALHMILDASGDRDLSQDEKFVNRVSALLAQVVKTAEYHGGDDVD